MKRLACLVLVCASQLAAADTESISTSLDAPDGTASELRRLTLRDAVVLEQPGVTAAFSVDPTVAEVSARDGKVTVIARGIGTTTISLVTATTIIAVPLTVVAPAPWIAGAARAPSSRTWTLWQGQYESSTARLTNSLEMVDGSDRRTLRVHAVNVLRLDRDAAAAGDTDARTTFPAASVEWRRGDTEVVALDKLVEHSPLTLDGTTVRGGHLRVAGLELHAGVTSPLLYQNVFLSSGAETVLGASYDVKAGRSTLTPSVYAYPSTPTTGGTRGAMGSLLHRYRSPGDHLQLSTELGFGGKLGAAGELAYQDSINRAWISARHEPRGFAAIGAGRPLGSMIDAMYSATPSKRLTLGAALTAARYQTAMTEQDVVTSMIESRIQIARRLATSAGISSGQFAGLGMAGTVRSLTVPLGLHLDGSSGGVSALYRYQTNSARNRGGHGGRLSARVHRSGLQASVFADAQQESATVELVLRDEPQLAQLLEELGLTATTPEELARLVRENATLAQLGYADGARLELDPWRMQVGGDVSVTSRGASRQQLRLRALANRTRTVSSSVEETLTASLSYSRQLGTGVDATALLSWWSHDGEMSVQPDRWSIAAGLRVRLDRVPHLSRSRIRPISGIVVDEAGVAISGVVVQLDGRGTTRSDAGGRFTFDDLAGGDHHVEATLPDGAYFASASRVAAEPGDAVRFVLGRAAAHLTLNLKDDAGQPLAAVAFELRGPRGARNARTDSAGRLHLATAPGDYELVPIAESIPVGYDVSALAATRLHLEAREPQTRELIVRAERSISGVVRAPGATIRIVELDRAGTIDDVGRYVFRRVPAGTFTLEVADAKGRILLQRPIDIPMQPVVLRGIDFP